jgi:hypothetical protein
VAATFSFAIFAFAFSFIIFPIIPWDSFRFIGEGVDAIPAHVAGGTDYVRIFALSV